MLLAGILYIVERPIEGFETEFVKCYRFWADVLEIQLFPEKGSNFVFFS
jgi:hypothetical protein